MAEIKSTHERNDIMMKHGRLECITRYDNGIKALTDMLMRTHACRMG